MVEHMVQFNKFHIGELVHNRETNEDGTIVGFRDTSNTPEYEVLVPMEPGDKVGALTVWSETALGL